MLLFLVIALSIPPSVRAEPASVQASQGQPQDILELQLQERKTAEKAEATDKFVTHLEQSVLIMLGFSGLTLAVLFGSIVLGEYRIEKAIRDLQDRAEEVKRRFPRLAEMEEKARTALSELEAMFPVDEWLEDRYGNLEISLRQHILSVEHLIALEFAGPSTAPQLRGMANFYFSKYIAERLASDLDRALYYALLADERGKGRFQYKNDLGFIYMDLAERAPEHRAKAKACLEESKRKNPAQQRCYYNLGLVYYDEAMKEINKSDPAGWRVLLELARDELLTALQQSNWETAPSPKLTSAIHYNLACFLCRLAADRAPAQGQSHQLDEVVSQLEQASRLSQTKLTTVIHDTESHNGDLFLLSSNHHYATRVKRVRAAFEKPR